MAQPGLILRQGMRGGAVRQLQQQLRNAGYDVAVDGVFGPQTRRAVQQFQQQAGLQVDGRAGGDTASALAQAGGMMPRANPMRGGATAASPMAPEQAAMVQALMAQQAPAGPTPMEAAAVPAQEPAAAPVPQAMTPPTPQATMPQTPAAPMAPTPQAPGMPPPQAIAAEPDQPATRAFEPPLQPPVAFQPPMRDPDSALNWSDPDRMMAMERARLGYIADKRAHDYHLQDRFGDAFQPGDPQGWAPRYGSFDTDAPPDEIPVPRPKPALPPSVPQAAISPEDEMRARQMIARMLMGG